MLDSAISRCWKADPCSEAWRGKRIAAARFRRGLRGSRCPGARELLAATAAVLLILGNTAPAPAASTDTAEIRGVILITKRLTKRAVTPVAIAYHRGVAVQPGGAEEDFTGGELGRVAIYLESAQDLAGAAVAATLKQKDRRFVEDTVVIPAGSSVSFPNLDPIFHNVFSLSRAKSFDLGNYPQNETRTVKFPKPGIVRVYCHLHPNMSASIVVTPNRWAVKPGSDGKYRLSGVPAGEHTVVVWHKSAGFFRERVKVAAGQGIDLNFTIPIGPIGPIRADASGAGLPPDPEP